MVLPRLIEIYDEAAADNYGAVAKVFDAAATKFTAAAKRSDPEADADSIVGQPDSVRQGWLDSTVHAAELDRLVPILQAAAELCDVSTDDDTALLPLVCDPAGAHRRRLWEAWKVAGPRCGHWAALAALVRLRAWPAADLDGFEAYRLPKPLVWKQFPMGGEGNRGIIGPRCSIPRTRTTSSPRRLPDAKRSPADRSQSLLSVFVFDAPVMLGVPEGAAPTTT